MQSNIMNALNEVISQLSDYLPTESARSDSWEWQYIDLINDILENGDDRVDRTQVGTRAVFGRELVIDLAKGFPAVTTKKLNFKKVKSETLFFVEGSSDERRLAEIEHGTRDPSKKTIWTDNANAPYWKPKAKFDGDLGRIYGVQWRHWQKFVKDEAATTKMGLDPFNMGVFSIEEVDQIAELINKLKTNPTDRRMIVSGWNVGELDQMALPPCHTMAQFFVEKGRLSCLMNMRSVDVMLGLPFDIAFYALLTHMVAQVTDLKVGKLKLYLADTHIYKNHIAGAEEQASREPLAVPKLVMNPTVKGIDDFKMDDLSLEGYESLEAIKFEMAV